MPNNNDLDLIRMQDTHNGSPIWNHAQANRSIVQDYSFWEIRNGNQALFWEDAWQQHPKLENPDLENYKRNCQNRGNFTVHQYWIPNGNDQAWREWTLPDTGNHNEEHNRIHNLLQVLLKRKIRITSEADKLRWGMKGNGNFTLKEARE